MATARKSKSTAPVEEVEVAEAETEAELTPKQIISEGIGQVVTATGIDVQKNRYKAMRAIAYQAFIEALEADDFEALVERAIANVDQLPAGWEIERVAKEETAKPVTKAKAAKPATKAAPTKAAAKPSARKRPTR